MKAVGGNVGNEGLAGALGVSPDALRPSASPQLGVLCQSACNFDH